MGALERARADIDEGRLWKARDRLEGRLGTDPHNQDALGLLADVCARMGDLPAAGRYLYLTESWGTGDAAVREAFEDRYGRSAADRLRALPARPPLEAYPPEVAARLGRLVAEAPEEAYRWEPKAEEPATLPTSFLAWNEWAVFAALVLLTLGIWILGLVFLVQLVF